MNENIITADVKYVFLDIVSYTYKRSIEAQTELINILNKIIKKSVSKFNIDSEQIIYIPTGDGICISLINVINPFDIHLLISLELLEKLEEHNKSTISKMRVFQIRIAINENIDNLITDINDNKNISGAGINYASRILSLCDGNQILIGNSVYEKLVQREKYMNSFSTYTGSVKHGLSLKVHQFLNEKLTFLNNEVPNVFKSKEDIVKKLPMTLAYYIALCILNEDFIIDNLKGGGQRSYSLIVLFYQLAEDYFEKSKTSKIKQDFRTKVKRELLEQFQYLQTIDFWLICDLQSYIITQNLLEFKQYFYDDDYLFIHDDGKLKLKSEFPQIYKEFIG